MLTVVLTLLVIAALAMLRHRKASFHAQRPADYAETGPAFDLRRHMAGPIASEGVIFGPTGKVAGSFVAEMTGQWDGATGTLTEEFHYATGARQTRQWHLTLANDGTFTATAADVIGRARGVISGATVRMTYRIKLDEDAGGHVLDVTDWLYLMDNGAIMNKSEMRKFGIKVAELVATMRPANMDSPGKDRAA